jgi:apolipoprotein N-acyltransferase
MQAVPAIEKNPIAAAGKAPLTGWQTAMWMSVAVAAFHAAYGVPALAGLMVVFLYALLRLTEAWRPRWAFYPAILVGIACYAPHLWFFTGIFGVVAFSLWTILAIWIGFFVLTAWSLKRVPFVQAHFWIWAAAVPFLWTGFEYFRCELYYFRFAWLTPGIAMAPSDFGGRWLVQGIGAYGAGFIVAFVAAALISGLYKQIFRIPFYMLIAAVVMALLLIPLMLPSLSRTRWPATRKALFVGIQLEGPTESEVLRALYRAVLKYPDAALLVMSEYTLDSPPTEAITDWCRRHEKYLIIGGKQPVEGSSAGITLWADTAFVVDPKGNVIFSQGKSVPIQFFDDGVPAKEQRIWNSPWGKIGICICYDLSYTRVTDELIRRGAQILIVPAMDAEKWGEYEHRLHARIAPVRAVEYDVQIMRVGSSGISQIISPAGDTLASAPFPGQGEMMAYPVTYRGGSYGSAEMPLDRSLAPLCVAATGLIAAGLLARRTRRWLARRAKHPPAPP